MITKGQDSECSIHYLFDDEYINLETLEKAFIGGFPIDFKDCSKYKNRFRADAEETPTIQEHQFKINGDRKKGIYELLIYKGETKIKTIDLPVKRPLPEVQEYSVSLFVFGDELVVLLKDFYDVEYIIVKYDKEGNELLQTTLEHTYITHPKPNTNHHHPYLYYHAKTKNYLIFSAGTFSEGKYQTVLLDINDFSIKTYEKPSNGILLAENEEEFAGFITMGEGYGKEKTELSLTMKDGEIYDFTIPYGEGTYNLLLNGDLLYMANYHAIATGSSLHCFNLKTGEIEWHADVLQLSVDHSEYWNHVTLSLYKNTLIMEGNEAYGDYLQFFDATTGERLGEFGFFGMVKED